MVCFIRQMGGIVEEELLLYACLIRTSTSSYACLPVIRSVLEHACQVFHRSLPDYLSTQIEAIQRRAMRTIYPDLNYAEALEAADLVTLFARRDKL
jgi:hypothetical protein